VSRKRASGAGPGAFYPFRPYWYHWSIETVPASDKMLRALMTKVYQERGVDLSQYKPNFVQRRVATRLRARGVSSFRAYMRLLDEEEYDRLLDALTINLTSFFRDTSTFVALRDEVTRRLPSEHLECRMRQRGGALLGGHHPPPVAGRATGTVAHPHSGNGPGRGEVGPGPRGGVWPLQLSRHHLAQPGPLLRAQWAPPGPAP